ncbi:MAG TPA: glycosyltransferase family 39 protein [Bauldia sp.]|nr:glycosyltransferase family 39 protein [Bauldia sp.]
MALTDVRAARNVDSRATRRAWLKPAFAAALPFLAILIWSAAVRLPFAGFAEDDEFLFAVVAREWLHGGLPYVTAFDIKPPGIFFIYAIVQAIFGASHAVFKGLEIVATAGGAAVLFLMLRRIGRGRLALWGAVLYPVYTLAFEGTSAVNMLLQLPFVIATFAAVFSATGDEVANRDRLSRAFLAGLAIGSAGMIKQTAVFEATAALLVLAFCAPQVTRLRVVALYVIGAALPALAFSAYFLAVGHFREMFDATVVLALHRVDPGVLAAYGPLAGQLTVPGAIFSTIRQSTEVVFLWGTAIFALVRVAEIGRIVPVRLLVLAVTWLAFALASVVFSRALASYYLLATIPPLLILSGAFFCYGFSAVRIDRPATLIAPMLLAIATLLGVERGKLFHVDPWIYDGQLVARTTEAIRTLGPAPDDRLLVLTRGLPLYVTTGLRPPTPYFHGTHLMTVFPTPVDNPLAVSLAANPRFIVLANPERLLNAGSPQRQRQALDYLAAHYRVAAVENGQVDTYSVYEFVR